MSQLSERQIQILRELTIPKTWEELAYDSIHHAETLGHSIATTLLNTDTRTVRDWEDRIFKAQLIVALLEESYRRFREVEVVER